MIQAALDDNEKLTYCIALTHRENKCDKKKCIQNKP